MTVTRDAFLGGRVQVQQPAEGYRAATDPVFLAAACPAKPGETVLEIGCGVGVALLCLAARVPDLVLTGLEIQSDYAEMAAINLRANGVASEVITGDLRHMPNDLRARSFDHVIFNPPFFTPGSGVAPTNQGRADAHVESASLAEFCDAALRRLRPGGQLTVVQRAERLGDVLSGIGSRAGDIRVRPISARAGRAAGRVVVRATKGSGAPMRLLAPFVVHDGPLHLRDGDDFSEATRAILREGAPLSMDG